MRQKYYALLFVGTLCLFTSAAPNTKPHTAPSPSAICGAVLRGIVVPEFRRVIKDSKELALYRARKLAGQLLVILDSPRFTEHVAWGKVTPELPKQSPDAVRARLSTLLWDCNNTPERCEAHALSAPIGDLSLATFLAWLERQSLLGETQEIEVPHVLFGFLGTLYGTVLGLGVNAGMGSLATSLDKRFWLGALAIQACTTAAGLTYDTVQFFRNRRDQLDDIFPCQQGLFRLREMREVVEKGAKLSDPMFVYLGYHSEKSLVDLLFETPAPDYRPLLSIFIRSLE